MRRQQRERGGGNSANAKACQKGGWASLYREDGSTFADQGACVSYAAKGGKLLTEPPVVKNCVAYFSNELFIDFGAGSFLDSLAPIWTNDSCSGDPSARVTGPVSILADSVELATTRCKSLYGDEYFAVHTQGDPRLYSCSR